MRLVTVIDGDTYMGVDMRGKRRKMRLRQVDCPELDQRNGQAAKRFVIELAGKQVVRVRLRGRDRHHRHLCDVRIDGQDLGLALVRAGMAYPTSRSIALRLAASGAWLQGKGVHRGFGQRKPWQASSRTPLGRWLKWHFRKRR